MLPARPGPARPGAVRVGAVDCGTSSIRLLVAEGVPGEAGLVEVAREMRIIRLGEGVDATGRLSDGALSRCRTALTDYTATMAELGVQAVRMVATSATRDARNKDEFFGMTAEVLGKHFPGAQAEVISGQTEAELTFAGGVSDLRPDDGPFVVTDLGGGSTENVVGELVGGEARLLGARSLDVGCVRITERVLHSDPPTAVEIGEARAVIADALAEAGDVPVGRAARWVGVAGTFTTLSALAQGLGEYVPERIHGSLIPLDRMRGVRPSGGVLGDRAPQLGADASGSSGCDRRGAIVVQALCDVMAERAGLTELTVSEKDILDGIAMSVLSRLAT